MTIDQLKFLLLQGFQIPDLSIFISNIGTVLKTIRHLVGGNQRILEKFVAVASGQL